MVFLYCERNSLDDNSVLTRSIKNVLEFSFLPETQKSNILKAFVIRKLILYPMPSNYVYILLNI